MHPVVDLLAGPAFAGGGQARLQVDDAHRRPPPRQLLQGVAPDIGEIDPARNRPAPPLRQLHVAPGIAHVALK